MSNPTLHLYAVVGREPGLMIIGTPSELAELGQELQRALSLAPAAGASSNFPPQLLAINAESPYRDQRAYQVSVNVQLGELPANLRQKQRYAPSALFFLVVTALSVLGAVSVPYWLWQLVRWAGAQGAA
jgi:hypothetical protein